jgi:hypothetical protein
LKARFKCIALTQGFVNRNAAGRCRNIARSNDQGFLFARLGADFANRSRKSILLFATIACTRALSGRRGEPGGSFASDRLPGCDDCLSTLSP